MSSTQTIEFICYPFGMVMPGRNWTAASAEGYRFGFNGKESDGEIKGDGNSLDYGARIYDPRLGKWLSIDPKQSLFSGLSPYSFGANSPIIVIDREGMIIEFVNNDQSDKAKQIYQSIYENADSETKAALDNLSSSDIVYRINVTQNMQDIEKPGGSSVNDLALTYFNADQTVQTGNVTVDIVIQLRPDYELTSAMGDELEQARQINEGEIGLLDMGKSNTGSSGGFTGGDIYDETNSKKGSIDALKSNKFTLKGDEATWNNILSIQGESGLAAYLKDPKNGYAGYINLAETKTNALGNLKYRQVKQDVKDYNLKGFIYRKQNIFGNYKTVIYKNKDYDENKPQGKN